MGQSEGEAGQLPEPRPGEQFEVEVGPEVVVDSTCISKERQYPLNQDLKSSEYLSQTAIMVTNSFPPCIHDTAIQF